MSSTMHVPDPGMSIGRGTPMTRNIGDFGGGQVGPAGHMGGLPGFPSSKAAGDTNFHTWMTNHYATNDRLANTSNYRHGDLFRFLPTFAQVTDPKPINADMPTATTQVSFSLPMLNYLLLHDSKFINAYSPFTSATHFIDSFQYCGVNETNPDSVIQYSNTHAMTDIVYGKVMSMPNIWHAAVGGYGPEISPQMGCIREGCHLYLLLIRVRVQPNETLDPSAWDAVAPIRDDQRKRKRDYMHDYESKRNRLEGIAEEAAQSIKGAMAIGTTLQFELDWELNTGLHSLESLVKDNPIRDYNTEISPLSETVGPTGAYSRLQVPDPRLNYRWVIVPYATYANRPPRHLLEGDPAGDPFNQFTGHFWYIGKVHHTMRGHTGQCTAAAKSAANDLLFPEGRNKDYQKNTDNVPHIEVMLSAAPAWSA